MPPDGDDEYEGPTCSICDGLGHGYPGGPPCPLEITDYSDEPIINRVTRRWGHTSPVKAVAVGIIEADCRKCGETFVISATEIDEEGAVEHVVDSDGNECGGHGWTIGHSVASL